MLNIDDFLAYPEGKSLGNKGARLS